MSLVVLIGGARSAKSSLAVEWGRRTGETITYIATAPRPEDTGPDDAGHDADMAERVGRHRLERPAEWTTVEETVDLAGAIDNAGGTPVIIDCLTLWTSNLMWIGRSDADIDELATRTAERAAGYGRPVLAITNEVGLGVHPETELGRRYRDVLGRVNQRWVATAERSVMLVAGRAIELGDPWALLADPAEPPR
jgi:adenosyl cobinamide kinase/adenosyl cobinamide phosphate guanylyltransferase